MKGSRRDRTVARVADWIIKTFASKEYYHAINALIALGEVQAKAMIARREIATAQLASQPGWDPVAQEIVNPD